MEDFVKPAGRLRRLPSGGRVVYSGFLVFTLVGLALTMALTHDMVRLDLSKMDEYYAGETEPREEGPADGPSIVIPPEGTGLAVSEPMPTRKLLEVTHFHLFSMPVYLLILSHLFMLSAAALRWKVVWIAVATVGTIAHIAAPWIAAAGWPLAALWYGLSGFALLLSYSVMCIGPLKEMWSD